MTFLEGSQVFWTTGFESCVFKRDWNWFPFGGRGKHMNIFRDRWAGVKIYKHMPWGDLIKTCPKVTLFGAHRAAGKAYAKFELILYRLDTKFMQNLYRKKALKEFARIFKHHVQGGARHEGKMDQGISKSRSTEWRVSANGFHGGFVLKLNLKANIAQL